MDPSCDAVVLDMQTGTTNCGPTTLHDGQAGDDGDVGEIDSISLGPIYFGPTGLLLEQQVHRSDEYQSTIIAYR